MSSSSLIENKLRNDILEKQIIPCIKKDIDDIILDRRRWEKLSTMYEYLRDIIVVGSFISVFFDSKVATGLLVALIGYFIKISSHALSRVKELTEKLNVYSSKVGIDLKIPEFGINQNETKYKENI